MFGGEVCVFPKRSAQTIVSIRDGQTIVAGGLIESREIETVRRVPFLGAIPLLGWFFRSVTSETSKSELLIFITPKVVMTPDDLQAVSDQEKERAGVSTEPPTAPKHRKRKWWH